MRINWGAGGLAVFAISIGGALSFRDQAAQFDPLVDAEASKHQELLLCVVRGRSFGGIGVDLTAKLRQQQLDGARVTGGALVDELLEHRFALGNLPALPVLVYGHGLVQRLQEKLGDVPWSLRAT